MVTKDFFVDQPDGALLFHVDLQVAQEALEDGFKGREATLDFADILDLLVELDRFSSICKRALLRFGQLRGACAVNRCSSSIETKRQRGKVSSGRREAGDDATIHWVVAYLDLVCRRQKDVKTQDETPMSMEEVGDAADDFGGVDGLLRELPHEFEELVVHGRLLRELCLDLLDVIQRSFLFRHAARRRRHGVRLRLEVSGGRSRCTRPRVGVKVVHPS